MGYAEVSWGQYLYVFVCIRKAKEQGKIGHEMKASNSTDCGWNVLELGTVFAFTLPDTVRGESNPHVS